MARTATDLIMQQATAARKRGSGSRRAAAANVTSVATFVPLGVAGYVMAAKGSRAALHILQHERQSWSDRPSFAAQPFPDTPVPPEGGGAAAAASAAAGSSLVADLLAYSQNWGIHVDLPSATALLRTTTGVFHIDVQSCCIFAALPEGAPKLCRVAAAWYAGIIAGLGDAAQHEANLKHLAQISDLALLHMLLWDIETLVGAAVPLPTAHRSLVIAISEGNVGLQPLKDVLFDFKRDMATQLERDMVAHSARQMDPPLRFMAFEKYKKQQSGDEGIAVVHTLGVRLTHEVESVILFVTGAQKKMSCECAGEWAPVLDMRYTIRPKAS